MGSDQFPGLERIAVPQRLEHPAVRGDLLELGVTIVIQMPQPLPAGLGARFDDELEDANKQRIACGAGNLQMESIAGFAETLLVGGALEPVEVFLHAREIRLRGPG